jgi:peptide/nickel transport system permease protein
MTAYIVRRLLQALVLMFLLSIMFFLMARFQPGGPCPDLNIGCVQAQHLDEPVTNQYYFWLSRVVHLDFGLDADGQPVTQVISQKLPATILLVGTAVLFQQLIALPLGILAATRQYSSFDQGLTFFSYVALSIPSFVLGIVLVNILSLHFGWLPTSRYEDVAAPILFTGDWWSALVGDPGYILGDLARHLFLPVLVLTAAGIAVDSRFMRASMLQVLHQDYIRTARAKGVGSRSVIFKHAFRNALLPVLTNFGLYVPSLLGGVIVVELVFQWEGLGYAFGTAIGIISLAGGGGGIGASSGDFGFIEATLMLATLVVLMANLLVDLAYVWLDPRIRFTARGEV